MKRSLLYLADIGFFKDSTKSAKNSNWFVIIINSQIVYDVQNYNKMQLV